ncbi:heavy metal translocating P-type ATPase [Pseudosulfitobacter koreensis]|uniref:Heavy metal translocating P-type ATPase n=1 Tax=Pseudosulfitobacter koreensis TaxID=2968472 RepID=A0ABT1Z2V3_9RHOB|nr:heavy metal translocating P-type ATPase [Pseudosulfitobacter koreense]MCR8827464.1 heavy metal translocating P-type ATPase [Pseudosulfitobacter koreense]
MTLHFDIDGMSCAGCAGRAERALAAIPGGQDARVNLATHSGQIDGVDAALVRETLTKAGYPARTHDVTLQVDNMTCGSCIGRVEAAALKVPGALTAHANLADMTLRVTTLSGRDTGALRRALDTAGYPAADIQTDAEMPQDQDRHNTASYRRRFMIAAVLTLPVFLAEMGGHIYPPIHHMIARTVGMQASHLIQMALTLAVLAGPGAGFFRRGIPGLLKARPDMDALVALGTSAAFAYSTVVTVMPEVLPADARSVYFEAAAVIVTLILLGRWFEARAKGHTGDAVRKLMALAPDTAMVQRGDTYVETPLSDIVSGDTLLARAGDRIATDGIVTTGSGHIDTAMLTGEPVPAFVTVGDAVSAGCINGTAPLHYTATRTGSDTMLARVVEMTREAQSARLPVQALINRVTAVFVPVVIAVATVTALVWLLVGDPTQALIAGVAVLIIACPCAMGLATPVSIMVGTGRAAELGVLFRQGDALQGLQSVKVVAFDKTGTLTMGAPTLTDMHVTDGFDRAALLPQVAAIEAQSEHPIARAIAVAAEGSHPAVSDITSTTGQGTSGTVEGTRLHIGNAAYIKAQGVDPAPLQSLATDWAATGATPVFVAEGERLAALIAVTDPIRDGAAEAIAALKASGVTPALITGDVAATAQHVARQLGIDAVTAAVPPGGKVAALEALRAAHGPVAFVGDGINDAPALAAADVGLAVASASDIAIEAADVVLMSQSPDAVLRARAISAATLRNIRQNLVWAFGYNALLIPVAAGLLVPFGGPQLSPSLAAGAMALSSVFVVTNALRLRRQGDTR